jgi:catechol 2,3-dioxygenase-like lactoylglutathione lyase family enzyme
LTVVSGVGQLSGVALECRDPAALAEFYSGLTGWPVVHAHADWYSVGENEKAGFHLSFQRAPGHQPPTWPDPASSMQIHLHFRVHDLDAAERNVLALGGTKLDDQPGADRSRVYADPAGHPFCLVPTRGRAE